MRTVTILRVIPLLFFTVLSLLSFSPDALSFETADIKFEVKKSIFGNRLTLRVQEGYRTLLDYSLSSLTDSFTDKGCILRKIKEGYHLVYEGIDTSSLNLVITDQGDICFPLLADTLYPAQETRSDFYKSWGFKTDGKVINQTESAFYKLFIQAKETHNYGVLKAYTGELLQDYLFNQGVIHFGDRTLYADINAYRSYFQGINPNAHPSFQRHIIDDYGVILAEEGLQITNLTHKAHGIVHVHQELHLNQASIENNQHYCISGSVTGQTHSITNHALFHADTFNTQKFSLQRWINTGQASFKYDSYIVPSHLYRNKGIMFSASKSTIGSPKKVDSIGLNVSDDEIKAILGEALDDASYKSLSSTARLFSKKRKIILDIKKHTDHYLNTITDHYQVDQYGRQTFTHRTETGYQFQRRSTEKAQKELTAECPETPQHLQNAKDRAFQRAEVYSDFLTSLKGRVKKLAQLYGNSRAVMNALAKALKAMGFSDNELSEILGDQQIGQALQGASVYDELLQNDQQDFLRQYGDYGQYVHNTSLQAQRLGLSTVEWIQQHGLEFLNHACDLFIAGSRLTKSPYVTIPASVCSLGKIKPYAIKYLEKAQVYFNKKHDGGVGKGTSSGSGIFKGSHQPIKAPETLPAFPDAVKAERKTFVQGGGGGMRVRWKDKNYIYEWDSRHGTVEKYNKRGIHLGEFDSNNGTQLKAADPTKKIEV